MGKEIRGKPISMEGLNPKMGSVILEGKVFAAECYETRRPGVWCLTFDMTDYKNSVTVRKYMQAKESESVRNAIAPGMWLRVQGFMELTRDGKDVQLNPHSIMRIPHEGRKDTYPEKRVELHLHTRMSNMDALTDTASVIKQAISWGHPAIAITDHGVAQAFPDAWHTAKGKIKILYGVEGYFVNNLDDRIAVHGPQDQAFSDEIVCFDIETTGLKVTREAITEIGAVVLKNGEITERFQTFVNPNRRLTPEIIGLTGITDAMLADAPQLKEALTAFLKFVNGRPLAAHNAEFDIGFIRAGCAKTGLDFDPTYVDSLILAQNLLPELKKYKLDIVAEHLDLPAFNHHRASDDAAMVGYMLVPFFEKMRKELGISRLQEINGEMLKLRPQGSKSNRFPKHIIILAKNKLGLKHLYQLISASNLKYFKRVPIIPKTELIAHREGLIIGSACEAGELFRAVTDHKDWAELRRIASFYDYLEIQPLCNNAFMLRNGDVQSEEELREFNRTIVRLGEELGKPVCATGDVHFQEPEDEVYRHVLLASKKFPDADAPLPIYFKTTDEMMREFAYLGQEKAHEVVIDNPAKIAARIGEIGLYPKHPEGKETFQPFWPDAADNIRNLCEEQIREWFGDNPPEIVVARKEKELSSILGYGYGTLYNIAEKLVKKSNADGYLVGSRGSVGSSYVAHLVGISEVNALPPHYRCPKCKWYTFDVDKSKYKVGVDLPPMKCPQCGEELYRDGFDIPFEVFLGFKGDKVPDIDLNFAGEYQSRIHWYTGEIFGHDHVFRAGTIGTVAEKTAFGYVKKYMEERGIECSRAEENRLAAGCTGVRRTSGQHPGGVVVVPKEIEIYDVCPIQHPADDPDSDIITTHFEYHSIDANLLKLDELGHDDPTIIKHLENLTGVNAQEIPLDDPETMSLFHSCKALKYKGENPDTDPILGDLGCVAVPEFGTKFVRGMVKETHPSTFAELVSISGLSHGTDVWLGNAAELVRKGIPLSGCICCRDDIMNYLILQGVKPKLSFKTMESVRKGKGLTEEMEAAMNEQHVPEWYIDSCKKIKYMFPKAHAVAYVMMAFRIAWFKVHRPLAFYSAYFSIRAKGFDASCMIKGDKVCLDKMTELRGKERDKTISAAEKDMMTTLEVCHEFYRRGFTFEPMDVYKSDATRFLVTETGLIPPFTSMPGIGEQAALSIVEERKNGKFLSAEELIVRCPKASKAVVELLEQIGALGSMPKTTQMTLF